MCICLNVCRHACINVWHEMASNQPPNIVERIQHADLSHVYTITFCARRHGLRLVRCGVPFLRHGTARIFAVRCNKTRCPPLNSPRPSGTRTRCLPGHLVLGLDAPLPEQMPPFITQVCQAVLKRTFKLSNF